jgi:hypothetical protein
MLVFQLYVVSISVRVREMTVNLPLEWTRSYATASQSRLELHMVRILLWETRVVPSWNVRAIARHTSNTTIEEWPALRVIHPMSPVAVWLVVLVPALFAEHLLERSREVSVPIQEVG